MEGAAVGNEVPKEEPTRGKVLNSSARATQIFEDKINKQTNKQSPTFLELKETSLKLKLEKLKKIRLYTEK